mgnify:CR=1 FL=1|jgi:hypothetical protein
MAMACSALGIMDFVGFGRGKLFLGHERVQGLFGDTESWESLRGAGQWP